MSFFWFLTTGLHIAATATLYMQVMAVISATRPQRIIFGGAFVVWWYMAISLGADLGKYIVLDRIP